MSARRGDCSVKIEDILATKGHSVETIGPEATVEHAAQRLRSSQIGALVVSADGEHLIGLVSDRDITFALAHYGRALLNMHVRDIMRRDTPTCSPVETVHDVMRKMTRSRSRHVPVIDG